MKKIAKLTGEQLKRIAIGIVGFAVLILGAIMIVTPGPAIVLIPAGLAILATQFEWARKILRAVMVRINGHRRKKGKEPLKLGIFRKLDCHDTDSCS